VNRDTALIPDRARTPAPRKGLPAASVTTPWITVPDAAVPPAAALAPASNAIVEHVTTATRQNILATCMENLRTARIVWCALGEMAFAVFRERMIMESAPWQTAANLEYAQMHVKAFYLRPFDFGPFRATAIIEGGG
jgi:hypothetical protein